MTADQKFLKEARISLCDIAAPRWMEWRDAEVVELRLAVATWIGRGQEQFQRAEFWKLTAFAGWLTVAIFIMSKIVEAL